METWISHDSMGEMLVDGYQAPNYYKRIVKYDTDLDELDEFIKRAGTCYQDISYRCTNSRILAKPSKS